MKTIDDVPLLGNPGFGFQSFLCNQVFQKSVGLLSHHVFHGAAVPNGRRTQRFGRTYSCMVGPVLITV